MEIKVDIDDVTIQKNWDGECPYTGEEVSAYSSRTLEDLIHTMCAKIKRLEDKLAMLGSD